MERLQEAVRHYLPLLQATLDHAVENTAYYRDAFGDWDGRLESLDAFQQLPVLSRATVGERGDEMVSGERVPDMLRNTSGSTFSSLGQHPLVTYHTWEEAEFAKRMSAELSPPDAGVRPIMLRLLSLDHGVDVSGRLDGVFGVPLANQAHFAHVLDLLQKRFGFEGFSERVAGLVGTLNRIKLLTVLCLRAGIEPGFSEVRFVGCHSQTLTDRWRRILTAYWGIEPTDIYGISEIPGLVGSRCETCGHYHLSPTAYVETVDPVTYRPVERGLARLLATGIYPLIRTQPLIRYDTEDLVEVMAPCPATLQPALEYVGRASVVVTAGTHPPELLLGPMQVHGVLDEEPDVAIEPSSVVASFGLGDEVGALRYLLRNRRVGQTTRIELDIELRWDPQLYPERAAALDGRVTKALNAASRTLPVAIEDGRAALDVNLRPPGSLDAYTDA